MARSPPDVLVTFMLGTSLWDPSVTGAEMQEHSDLCVVPGTNYTDSNAHIDQKCFEFFRAVLLRLPLSPFLMLADDDSYINLPRVAADLRTLRSETRLVYGGIEWYSYDPLTGLCDGYGKNMDEAVNKHPSSRANYKANFSAPFPFVKGPLMVFSSSVARELVHGKYGRAAQVQSGLITNTRINIDIFIGYILATARDGAGAANLTWVDIGVSKMSVSKGRQGFLELRSGRNLTNSEEACYRVVHFGTNKRTKIAETITKIASGARAARLITRNVSASIRNDVDVMREGMASLTQLACSFYPLSFNSERPLASCASYDVIRQFSFRRSLAQARMFYGSSWTLCEVWRGTTRTYQNWSPPAQSVRARMLNRMREQEQRKGWRKRWRNNARRRAAIASGAPSVNASADSLHSRLKNVLGRAGGADLLLRSVLESGGEQVLRKALENLNPYRAR